MREWYKKCLDRAMLLANEMKNDSEVEGQKKDAQSVFFLILYINNIS